MTTRRLAKDYQGRDSERVMVKYTCVSGNGGFACRAIDTVTVDGTAYEEWSDDDYVREIATLTEIVYDDGNTVREVAVARGLLDELTSGTIVHMFPGRMRSQAELNAIVREIVPLIVRHVNSESCTTWLRDWNVRVCRVLVPCAYRMMRPEMLVVRQSRVMDTDDFDPDD